MEHEKDVQTLSDWLNNHLKRTIIIEKHELDDTDEVHFIVTEVDIRSEDNAIDDYVESSLILHGEGSTSNADGDNVPLPQNTYEIALHDLRIDHIDDTHVKLNTERAQYALTAK